VDYDLNAKNRLSAVGAIGTQIYVNNFGTPYIPLPYEGGDLASVFPKQFVVEETYTVSARMVNQFKAGFTRQVQGRSRDSSCVSFTLTRMVPLFSAWLLSIWKALGSLISSSPEKSPSYSQPNPGFLSVSGCCRNQSASQAAVKSIL